MAFEEVLISLIYIIVVKKLKSFLKIFFSQRLVFSKISTKLFFSYALKIIKIYDSSVYSKLLIVDLIY